ncbi:peptidyl-prolyl cis-trans isomerase [Paraliobacillus sp. JSM ZJ581]|uniref:peptidyl-prolyl cis-trans isomerase n=1 Tax=Paraliobacillus sp. JSM ZJ581 TaxID=3342118 RepID=UPI0035A8CCD6
MRRKLVLGSIVVLLITNVVTLGMWLWSDNIKNVDYSVDFEPREPVAKVNGEKIAYKEWIGFLENRYGKKALKDMINTRVVTQLADQEKVSFNQEVLQLELSLLSTMEGKMSKKSIEEKEAQWTEEVTDRLYLEELVTKDVKVSEQEIRSYYEKYGEQYHFSPTIQLSHIIVSDEDTAEEIIKELDAGASFSSLASKYTLDEETKNNGGYLGFYTKDSSFLPNEYYEQTEQLDNHTYSDPFRTAEGITIVYLHRFLPEVNLSYEQLHAHLRREVALEKTSSHPDASKLWDNFEVEWIYE